MERKGAPVVNSAKTVNRIKVRPTNAHDLHQAVVGGDERVLLGLLSCPSISAHVINKTVGGATQLSLSLYLDRSRCFEALMTHPVVSPLLNLNILSKDDKHRLEPILVTCCRLQNAQALDMLLARDDIDVNLTDNEGRSPLWMATNKRDVSSVRKLLARGADPNRHRVWQLSPLYFAIRYSARRLPIAGMLIQAGADVGAHNASHSLLHVALRQGDRAVADLLLAVGYRVSQDRDLMEATRDGRLSRDLRLTERLLSIASTPSSLLSQCRSTIRRRPLLLRELVDTPRNEDAIPASLRDYLKLAHVMSRYYAEFEDNS